MGGGGNKTLKYTDIRKKIILICASERAPQKHTFSRLKILVTSEYIGLTINSVPFHYLWCGAINDNIPTNNKTKKIYVTASELRNVSHSKTAISFTILLVFLILCQYTNDLPCRLTCTDKSSEKMYCPSNAPANAPTVH